MIFSLDRDEESHFFLKKVVLTDQVLDKLVPYFMIHPRKLTHAVRGDEDEFLNVYHLTKEEALAAIEDGRICDFKTVYAIQYLMLTQRW